MEKENILLVELAILLLAGTGMVKILLVGVRNELSLDGLDDCGSGSHLVLELRKTRLSVDQFLHSFYQEA
jgi:hypothetical protein